MPQLSHATRPRNPNSASCRGTARDRRQRIAQLGRRKDQVYVLATRPRVGGRWMKAVIPTSVVRYCYTDYTGPAVNRGNLKEFAQLVHSYALNYQTTGYVHRSHLKEAAAKTYKHFYSRRNLIDRLLASPMVEATTHPDVFYLRDFREVQSNRTRLDARVQSVHFRELKKAAKRRQKAALRASAKKPVNSILLTEKERIKEKEEKKPHPTDAAFHVFCAPPAHVLAQVAMLDHLEAPKPQKLPRARLAPADRAMAGATKKPRPRTAAPKIAGFTPLTQVTSALFAPGGYG